MDWLKHLFTGIDNETADIGRHALFIGIITFAFLAVYAVVVKGQIWDPQAFGLGFGAVLAGGGAGIAMKAKTEPGG